MKRSNSDLFLLNMAAVAAVLIILAMAMWNYITINRNRTYADWVNHTHEVIEANNQMLTETVNAETSVRGFGVTHDQSFLQTYYESREKARASLNRLRIITPANSLEQRHIDTMGNLANSRLTMLDELIKIATDSVVAPATFPARIQEGRWALNQLRLASFRFNEKEEELLQKRKSSLHHEHNIALVFLIGGTLISLFFFLIVYFNLLRQMQRYTMANRAHLDAKASQETLQLVENLQRKNNDLRQFAFIVSHNLRAPIAKIQGLADLFPHDIGDELNNKIIVNILSELKNLDQVVNDLTDIISLREIEHRTREQISLHEELKRVTMILSDQINAAGVTITEDFQEAPAVYSIRSYMHSIFMNLISNAVKYCAAGRKPEITLRSQISDPFICISVQDNGLGIDLAKHGSKLFTLYKRFHNHVDGRGIGLYMVKTQVESLGGKIEVMSKEDEGTTFNVFLPKN